MIIANIRQEPTELVVDISKSSEEVIMLSEIIANLPIQNLEIGTFTTPNL